jgi:uncharacterized membrane protein YesL
MKVQAACEEVLWAARLNLVWLVFTLAGGVILGVGPATLAAYTLARRHTRGESFHVWMEFWAVYRRDFFRGNLLVLPMAVAAVLLVGNLLYLSDLGPGVAGLRIATLAALAALVLVGSYLGPIYAHYDLPLPAYLPKASLFAITRPAASVLQLFLLSGIAFATAEMPVLAPLISFGAWISLNTWLCLRFFQENEARLHSKGIS